MYTGSLWPCCHQQTAQTQPSYHSATGSKPCNWNRFDL